MAREVGDRVRASTMSHALLSRCGVGWGGREGVSLRPWCGGDLLFVSVCPGTTEPACLLPLSLPSVSELINVLTSVRSSRHFWSPCSPAAAMRCFGLVPCIATEGRGWPGVRDYVVPFWLQLPRRPDQLFPVAHCQAADVGGEVSLGAGDLPIIFT